MAEQAHFILRAINRTGQAFGEVRRSLGEVDGAASKLNRVLGTLGVGLSVGALTAFAKSAVNTADELNKQSQSLGVSVENLQVYQRAAKFAGIEAEALSRSLGVLAKNVVDAADDKGLAKDAFARLQIELKNTGGAIKSTDEILLELADRFAAMPDGIEKTGLAAQVFGTTLGSRLIPFLNGGRANVAAMREELERMGILISTDTARQAEILNDQIERLGDSFTALKVGLLENLIPALTRVVDKMVEAQRAGGALDAVIAGIQTTLTGDDLHKANVEFTRLTSELLATERELAGAFGKRTTEELAALEEHATRLRDRLGELQRFRDRLEGKTDIFGAPVAPTAKAGTQAAGARPLTAAELKKLQTEEAKIYALIAAGEEEFQKESDEAWAIYWATQVKRQGDALKIEEDRMKAWFEFIDREQEEAIAEGAILAKDITDEAKRLEEQTRRNENAARDLGLTFTSAFEDAVIEGEKFRDVLKGIAQDILRIFLRQQVTGPAADALKGAFSGFDLGSIFSGGSSASAPTALQLSGPFQHGGGFTVGGSGGTDRTFVGFRATAGEQVSVTPPGQHGGGGPTFYVDMRGATGEAVARLERLVREVNGSIEPRAVAAVANARLRGGSFSAAFGG